MKKKVFSLMMTLLLAFMGVAKAEVVEIGVGGTNTNSYLPNYEFYNYSLTQQIYTADEIGTAGTINSIAFFYTGTATRTVDVYMVNTTVSSFASNNDWIAVTAADKVYSGSVTYTANEWNTFVLDTPFAYDGTSNLAVIVDDNTGSYVSSVGAYVFDATGMSIRLYNDYTDYDPLDPPTGSGAVLNVKNQIQLDITPGGGGGVVSGELTVYDGTATNGFVPVYGFYADAYLKAEFVMPAAELADMANGDINSVKFYATSPATDAWTSTFQVFMKEVNDATISDFSGTDGATVVYEGLLNGTASEMEIVFSTPYHYNGGNLLIGVYNITTGNYKSITWAGETVTGASVQGYNYSSLSGITATQRNFLPKTTFAYTVAGGGPVGDQLHVKYMAGDVEVIDELNLGVRPAGAWMEPFNFTMYSEGPTYTVNVLDFTPSDGMFTVAGQELPFQVVRNEDVALNMSTNGTEAGVIERQFVAITEGNRAAHIWPVTVELYAPECPDVWELACEEATTFPFVEVPATAHNTVLHNDYTLPFPEIPEGLDAVYKLVFTQDQMVNAEVTYGDNGKVALYREGFEGEGGPMATNNYTGIEMGGGAAAAPFEAQIGEGTSTTGYFPFYTLYNYSIAENLFLAPELEEAGVTTAPMTSLSWYATNTTGYNQQGITIWMANVDDEALTTTSHVVTNMTKVYTGAMTPLVGWNEFVFNEGTFAWDGHSNILIYCQRNNGSWNSTVYWQATASLPFNAMAYRYQDSGAYDETIPNTMYTSTTRPNIIMKADGRNRDEITYGFESGLEGWTVIDVNVGEGTWVHSSANPGGYDYTERAHGGTGFAMCYSFIDYVGSFDTDSYLVSPQKYSIGANSTLSFFADNANDSYPEYFSVCVSTAANPGANDFTQVWSGSAKNGSNSKANVRHQGNRYGNWRSHVVDLSAYAGQEVWIAFHDVNYDMYEVWIDDVTITTSSNPNPPTPPTPGTGGTALEISAGPVIENLPVTPGTYYLVASSTTPNFEVTINAEDMPCPAVEGFAFNPVPADDADGIEPASVTLSWSIPQFATGWRLIFGTTYYPDPNHPQTIMYPEDGSFTTNLANSYTVRNLWNNTNYFWRVEFNNDCCPGGVSSPVWGFTTHLNVPQNLTAVDETVFNDETIVLNWTPVVDRTYRMYNVYRDGELIGHTNMNQINNSTYTDGPLAYNMAGYTYYVTAVYDEGESAPSNTVNVKVSGYGNVDGHVFEQDGTTGIAGATVTMVGIDEFNAPHTYNFTTNAQGYYSAAVYAGTYNGQAAKDGYQTITEPVQGNPIGITYNVTTSPIDYMLDENFDPVCSVLAEYYPDPDSINAPYVKVSWGCGLPGEEIIEPFETGDFSLFDWQIDPTYPWVIDSQHAYEGNYCMKSGNQQVLSSTSTMQVTVNIPSDGIMSFFGKISCESGWDYGYFYIDGVQKGSYTGEQNWAEKKFDITAGDHTFKWEYTEDFIISQGDDCFYVDYITFYKRPEPAQPGWHTYCESEFNNAVGSNLTTTPSWAYEYPASFLHTNYAGWQITKVSLFSDNMYGAVGGNYTCRIYVGGNEPAAGTMVSTITVDVPSYQNAWVDWDLNDVVNVTGNDPIWVVWTANSTVSSWPAGCCGDLNDYGTWWDGGNGWEHLTYGTWTMRHWFTNRAGRSVAVGTSDNAKQAAVADANPLSSRLRTYKKGDNEVYTVCANANAVKGAALAKEGARSLNHYRVYRTNCYNDGPYTEDNTVLLATVWVPDTVYIDVEWSDLPAGVYKWGVGAVYAGNRGEEIAAPINWSEPVNVNNAEATRADFTYGFESDLEGWTVIDVNAGEGTWLHSSANPGGYDYTTHAHGGTGFAMCYSFVDYVGSYNTDSYLVSPQKYSIENGSTITFYADNANDSYPENFSVCVATTSNAPTASDFTSVWSGGAKGGSNAKADVRHDSNRYDNWREHSIDLSAYAGQEVWIAFHDVNYDMYEVWIDDVTIVASSGSGPNPGGNTNNLNQLALPRESETIWSNCLDKDMWLENALDVTVLLNSADSPEGVMVSFENLNPGEQELYPMGSVVLDQTGFYVWDSFRKGDYKVTVSLDGYETIEENVSIWEPTSLRYVMIEIIYGVNNLYVSRTGWAMWDAEGMPSGGQGGGQGGGNGDTFSVDFEGGLPAGWTVIDANNDGYTWCLTSNIPSTWTYYASLTLDWYHSGSNAICSGSYINGVGALNPDEYLVSPQVTLAAGSQLSFWVAATDASYPADHFGVFVSDNGTSNWTSVQEWTLTAKKSGMMGGSASRDGEGLRLGNWYNYTVDLSAYAGQKYIAFRHFNCYDQYIMCLDDVELTTGAKDGDRHLEGFKVLCTSIDGEPIYNANTVHPFCQLATDQLVEGDHYICKVAAIYSTGMSDWVEAEWEYESCMNYAGTLNGLDVNGTTVTWDYPGGGTGPTPPGGGDTFSVDFENSQIPAGWTTIDGGSPQGYGWQLASVKIGSTGYGHNASNDCVLSQSYDNSYGVVYPDNYLVSPQVNLANGSTFSFYACAQDASYAAEHFGVFISDNGTSNWTMVNEWTMTAKGGGVAVAGRDGRATLQGNWYQYSVDLSGFAGQKYIAIRHFNCSDMFYLDVDDIELTAGAKGNRAPWDLMMTFNAAEAAQYGVAYDGNNFYTSNWGYSSATHNFFKYDLSGNMLEGFEIAGCGTLRGMTYDGQYTYGVANSNTVYCIDLAAHNLVSTFTSSYGAMRGITYDPERDGFWVIGNWSGNLTLIDRNGAVQFTGPAPESASDLAYYKDENDVEHVFCFNNGNNGVYDYNITTNTLGGSVFDFSSTPGYDGGSSGGCTVASFNNKMAFIGDIQQDPNLIGIYELRDDQGTGPVPPVPAGNILGAMVFLNGEWEAFVPYPTNSYEFPEGGEYCVRIVYDGTADLPSNNFYYAMSCEECEGGEPGPGTCEPGAPIHSELVDANHVKVWWGDAPVPGMSEWLYYDDGVYGTSIGVGGGVIYWASMFPAASIAPYAGTNLTKVALYENSYNTDVVTVNIYLGGSAAPGTLVSTMNYNPVGGDAFHEVALTTPVAIDGTQNLWIVFSENGTYPANACADTGDPNNRWVSLDGADWMDVASAGVPGYGWMIRGFVTNEGKGGMVENIALEQPAVMESSVGMTLSHTEVVSKPADLSFMNRSEIVKYNVYRSDDNVTYDFLAAVDAVAGQTYYEYIDSPTVAGTYYYQVRADYGDCESEPAMAADDPTHNYVIGTTTAAGVDEIDNNVALFPNPTNGNVTIQAQGMSHITVVSVLGQVVYDAELNADEVTLNMGQFNAGMYMVRVYTENGVTVKRVTVLQ